MDALSKRNDFAEKFGPASIKKHGIEEQQQKRMMKRFWNAECLTKTGCSLLFYDENQ